MAFVLKETPAGSGTFEIATGHRLPNGKLLRDAVKIDGSSRAALADRLAEWHDRSLGDVDFEVGTDRIALCFGGTDWQPKLILFNHGPNGGSMSMGIDEVPSLIDALRVSVDR